MNVFVDSDDNIIIYDGNVIGYFDVSYCNDHMTTLTVHPAFFASPSTLSTNIETCSNFSSSIYLKNIEYATSIYP